MAGNGPTEGLSLNLREPFMALLRYLNRENQKTQAYTCILDDVNEDEFKILRLFSSRLSNPELDLKIKSISEADASLLFLGSLKGFGNFTPMKTEPNGQIHLKLVFSDLAVSDAKKLIKLIEDHTFNKIDIAIQTINVYVMHLLFEAIAKKQSVTELNIVIPDYNCNNIEALRAYLKTRQEQPPSRTEQNLEALLDTLSSSMQQATLMASTVKANALEIGRNAYNRSAAFLNHLATSAARATPCMVRPQTDPDQQRRPKVE